MKSIMEFVSDQSLPFVRMVGMNDRYLAEIKELDSNLTKEKNQGISEYACIKELPRLMQEEDMKYYKEHSGDLREQFAEATDKVLEKFCECTPAVSEAMKINFLTKLAFWMDKTIYEMISSWHGRKACRVVYCGSLKKQEYLFCYFLSNLGMGVMILAPEGDDGLDKRLAPLSQRIELGQTGKINLAQTFSEGAQTETVSKPAAQNGQEASGNTGVHISLSSVRRPERDARTQTQISAVNVRRPERDARTQQQATVVNVQSSGQGVRTQIQMQGIQSSGVQPQGTQAQISGIQSAAARAELSYEQLASLAASVVLIHVHDQSGNPLGTGSGIMINEKGYILTNYHVASHGPIYSVRIEGDERVYQTSEMIKYNQMLDLALIRLDRRLSPLPIYNGSQPLVRGQRVVAIGSPLGLFNSVSDGIISGFRDFEHVEMIQFTAPISNGSSGGAVLNMYGEVIGISTAGFDSGQNINLAVNFKCIRNFAGNFLSN